MSDDTAVDDGDLFSRDTKEAMAVAFLPSSLTFFGFELAEIQFIRCLVNLLFPGFAVVFLVLAYRMELHSFWNLLLLELSSGCAFFAAAPHVIRFSVSHKWRTRLVVFGISIGGIAFAYAPHELVHALSHRASEF